MLLRTCLEDTLRRLEFEYSQQKDHTDTYSMGFRSGLDYAIRLIKVDLKADDNYNLKVNENNL